MGAWCAREGIQSLFSAALEADSEVEGGQRLLFVAGEDAEAKKTVSDLIVKVRYAAIDLGGLEKSRLTQFPGGPLGIVNLVKLDSRSLPPPGEESWFTTAGVAVHPFLPRPLLNRVASIMESDRSSASSTVC